MNFTVSYQLNTFKYDFTHVFPHSDTYEVNHKLLNIVSFMYFHIQEPNGSKFTDCKPTKMIFCMNLPFYLCLSSVLSKMYSNQKIDHQVIQIGAPR